MYVFVLVFFSLFFFDFFLYIHSLKSKYLIKTCQKQHSEYSNIVVVLVERMNMKKEKKRERTKDERMRSVIE